MSMDNGFVIRKSPEGEYVLQEYSASAEEFPPIEKGRMRFSTLDEAIKKYMRLEAESSYGLCEYGLSFGQGVY